MSQHDDRIDAASLALLTLNPIPKRKGVALKYLIRPILTILLLVVVWHHSHWSVALSLTLLFLFTEATTLSNVQANKRFNENPIIKRYLAEHEQRKQSGV